MGIVSPKLTLIYIGHNQLVRCDVTARGKARGTWSRPRPVGMELPGLVDAALRAGGRRPGDVYVLATDFWSQKVTLSDDATHGLHRDEVSRSLAFEAESLSGLAALDSEIGYCVTSAEGKQRDYWIVQIPSWVREQIDSAVRQTGGRLRGLAHPGGLPQPLTAMTNGAHPARWLRVEGWPGMVIAVGAGADQRLQNVVSHADARGTGWRAGVEALRQSLGPLEQGEQLVDAGIEPPLGGEFPTLRLSDESAVAAWLPHWGAVLSRGSAPVPVLQPPKRPMAKWVRGAASVALAAGVAGVCAWDGWTLNKNIHTTQSEIADSKAKTAALEATKTQVTALEKQVAERLKIVERVQAEVAMSEAVLTSYRTRWPRLLDSLARLCPANTTVREIIERDGRIVIQGTSLNATVVDQLASALSGDLRGGWLVSPAQKTIAAAADQEVCQFSLELREVSPTQMHATTPMKINPTAETAISQR